MAAIITPNKTQKEKKKVDNLTSPMVLDPLQTSNHNHCIPTPNINSPNINPKPNLGKRSSSFIDPFAMCVDVNTLVRYNK